MEPDEKNPPAATRGGDRCRGRVRRAAGLDHDVEPAAVSELEEKPAEVVSLCIYGLVRAEDGWMDMDVRWLLTRDTVGAEHSVFGITVFPPGAKHDIHRHPNAEEFEYLVSGRGIARVGDADVELGPGEVVFVPKNEYHGFANTGDEPVFMIWGYAGAASLDEAGYIRYDDDHAG